MTIDLSSDFANGAEGWSAGFTDYALTLADLGLSSGIRPMPENLGLNSTGYYIQGRNSSDDLFMFLARRLTPENQIKPNTTYRLEYEIQFASDAPSGAIGIGGAPGEAVFVKAGASSVQPIALIDVAGQISINIDKGNQSQGGRDVGVAGNVANGRNPEEPTEYALVTLVYQHPTPVTADANGNLWLVVGTDSGFEGPTALYYTKINVKLSHCG
ncbi:hypothetical protein D0962_37540 [Leptolyngbyaceae cyanobacterium CCMR0082]|uniref:Uncharacterized protein n=1 Tax=Adonisia turfae CCMR0082 TaxID=2304604 RepID=A0A6M0SIP9_9CYAN|nr:hypothetical protein [Adonisia turfae]NEZ68367.1 hypothetical protein [Adonisia turfae CCMR0082]